MRSESRNAGLLSVLARSQSNCHNSHVIRLLHTASRLVAIARTVVSLESLAEYDRLCLLRRQGRLLLEVQLLNQLKACKTLRGKVSKRTFANANNILFCRGEWEARALFRRTSHAVCVTNGIDGLSWKRARWVSVWAGRGGRRDTIKRRLTTLKWKES